MRIPKRYGEYRLDKCPFCEKQATAKNKQGLLVCPLHKESVLPDIKCACGSWLDIREGKYGPYFVCINCGNLNLKKGLEMMEHNKIKEIKEQEAKKEASKEDSEETKTKDKSEQKQTKQKVHFKETKDEFILDSGKYKNFDYGIE